MNSFLRQIIFVAGVGDWENAIWMQILVIIILAALWGVYTFVKNRPDSLKENKKLKSTRPDYSRPSWQFHQQSTSLSQHKEKHQADIKDVNFHTAKSPKSTFVSIDNSYTTDRQKAKRISSRKRTRNTKGGMELIDPDILLQIVDNTEGKDENDVTIRKLAFNELIRRQNQSWINSIALTVYAVNKGKLYDKGIQCEAMKELAERTSANRNIKL
jgi:hypothetical protein